MTTVRSNPLVSVIIPVYNREGYLAEAIDSVLAQSYGPTEVMVIDDGSTDASGDVARSYQEIHYIYQANQGPAVARNTGLARAQGDMIAFLDADDRWRPDKLRLQVDYLVQHPDVDCTIGRIENFYDRGIQAPEEVARTTLEQEQINLMTLVARREVFERVGGFDPSYRVGSDLEWVVRAKDAGVVMVMLPRILLDRRIHDDNISHQTEARIDSWLRMLKESVDRQRKPGDEQKQGDRSS